MRAYWSKIIKQMSNKLVARMQLFLLVLAGGPLFLPSSWVEMLRSIKTSGCAPASSEIELIVPGPVPSVPDCH